MPKIKQKRFRDITEMPNVIEHTEYELEPTPLRGKWNRDVFETAKPIILELACGKGEYSLGLSELQPENNYIGVDIKGNRMWVGANRALEEERENVRFLRAFVDHIHFYFGENEVSEIWIIFPDPQLKKDRKKLTSPMFLERYKKILKPGGRVHLKTDSEELYEYTKETIKDRGLQLHADISDVYAEGPSDPRLEIRTYYEKMHLKKGKKIRYLSFGVA